MHKLTGYLICKTEQEVALIRQYLPEHQRLSREEAGCLSFNVTVTDNPRVWKIDELFTDSQAFAQHQQRTRASEWGKVTAGITREFDPADTQ